MRKSEVAVEYVRLVLHLYEDSGTVSLVGVTDDFSEVVKLDEFTVNTWVNHPK